MTVDFRIELDGVEADLASTGRLLYRAGRRRIAAVDAIYQRDALVPSVPRTQLSIAPEELAGLQRSYRLLSYYLSPGADTRSMRPSTATIAPTRSSTSTTRRSDEPT
jgi:hypothetical protein